MTQLIGAQIVGNRDEQGVYHFSWLGSSDALAPVNYAAEKWLSMLPFRVECVKRDDATHMAWYRLVTPDTQE